MVDIRRMGFIHLNCTTEARGGEVSQRNTRKYLLPSVSQAMEYAADGLADWEVLTALYGEMAEFDTVVGESSRFHHYFKGSCAATEVGIHRHVKHNHQSTNLSR